LCRGGQSYRVETIEGCDEIDVIPKRVRKK
jgi:hypothetical protein